LSLSEEEPDVLSLVPHPAKIPVNRKKIAVNRKSFFILWPPNGFFMGVQ
jgi:hypothetical protein